MAISVNWATKIINVPKADLTLIQSSPTEIREMDLDWFRLELKKLEDDEGMPFLDTHRHSAPVTVGGVTLARVIEIINDYTVTFEDGQYAVNLVGANSNIADRANVNQVSIRSANSAGLVVTAEGGSAPTVAQIWSRQVEGAYTAEQVLRIMAAALAGKVSGAEGTNPKFRDLADTKDRIDATADQYGNRSAVVLDAD